MIADGFTYKNLLNYIVEDDFIADHQVDTGHRLTTVSLYVLSLQTSFLLLLLWFFFLDYPTLSTTPLNFVFSWDPFCNVLVLVFSI